MTFARTSLGLMLAATALVAPQAASAATAKEKALEARLEKLEAQMAQLQSQLSAAQDGQAAAVAEARAAQAQASAAAAQAAAVTTQVGEAKTKLATLETKPAPEGFRDGNTTIKLGGYLKMIAARSRFSNGAVPTNTLGRDFYLPQTLPTTVGGHPFTSNDFTAKQTRLWLNLESQVAGHTVKGYLETDFQVTAGSAENVTAGGSQRTTNGYTLALRRATLSVDRFTFGQDWTTFQYTAALPETTDYVGGAEGTVFVRQPLVRYTMPLSKQVTLMVSVENPESALVSAVSAGSVGGIVENGADRLPDLAGRLVITGKQGEVSLAGLVRQVRGEFTAAGLINNGPAANLAGSGATANGFGASVGGKLFLNAAKTSDLRMITTFGHNIGRYVGLNFAPDAVYNPATNALSTVEEFATLVSGHFALTPQVRANLMGSYQHVSYSNTLTMANLNGLNKQAWSMAANLFYSPVKNVDLGLEYRHGERKVINATTPTGDATGKLDRIEFAAKYSF